MLKKLRTSTNLSHAVKWKYVASLKLASDKDIDWLYDVTRKEYDKRFKVK